jgi:radical SAM protein with 4Fe4S-binding SPASM domain
MFDGITVKAYKALQALATRKLMIEFDRIPHRFDGVPLNKILNWILVEASVYLRPSRPWGMPTHLQVEPTNHCNLKCTLCPVADGLERTSGHMDPGVIKKIIDEIGEYLFFVLFWDWGEPFLNDKIYEMISLTKKRGIRTATCTNGHALADKENAEKTVRSGLDTLIVAIDGTTQESYERYRRGGNLETVLRGIRNVVRLRGELKSETPLVNLRFIVMKDNEGEVPGLELFARNSGADVLTMMKLNPYIDDIYSEGTSDKSDKKERDSLFLPSGVEHKRFKAPPGSDSRVRLKRNPCKHLWNNPVIHWNGTVCPCCYDFNEKYPLGDLERDSFKEIWYGAAYRRMRSEFRSRWEEMPLCRECSHGYEGGNLWNEAVTEAVFLTPGPSPEGLER